MIANKKEEKAIQECYSLLYANSEPKADFKELVNNAMKDENGMKTIDFMSYEIERHTFDKILEGIIKKYKISPGYRSRAFKNSICLGVSPKFKSNIKDDE